MKRTSNGATVQQFQYAKEKLAGGKSKYAMAIRAGYSPATASKAAEKIESTEGYQNAMAILLRGSTDIVADIMDEYKKRGFDKFSNKDLNGALNSIASAWEKLDKKRGDGKAKDPNENPLRAAVIQRANQITNVTVQSPKDIPQPADAAREAAASEVVDDPNDF